jgi:hypothetical protein
MSQSDFYVKYIIAVFSIEYLFFNGLRPIPAEKIARLYRPSKCPRRRQHEKQITNLSVWQEIVVIFRNPTDAAKASGGQRLISHSLRLKIFQHGPDGGLLFIVHLIRVEVHEKEF